MMVFRLVDGEKISILLWDILRFDEITHPRHPARTQVFYRDGTSNIVQGDIVDLTVQYEDRLKTVLGYIGK